MNRPAIFWSLILILLFGCGKKITNIFDRVGDKIEVNDANFDYLTAKAKVEFDDGEKDISGIANIRMRKDSVMWISLSPGFGVEVVRAIITKDSIRILDKINKQYISMDFESLSKKFDFDMDFKILESVIIGNLVYPYRRERIQQKENYYAYNQQMGKFLLENFIGSESMKLERFRVEDAVSKNSISVNYGDFQLVEEEIFPFQIKAQFDYADLKKKPTKLGIEFKQAVMENKPLRFPFNVPSKYGRK